MMDSSKQLLSALLTHVLNVILAMELSSETDKNACIWYFITFMLDSTMGILLIFLLMKSLNMIFTYFDMRVYTNINYSEITKWQLFQNLRKCKNRWVNICMSIICMEFCCNCFQIFIIWISRTSC
ncbi:unnamed protein product [Paramecium primaurelia]|uniref:Uncharacterized protein n=1 Tax=Paramecium primaurelia TaxID=5886 RepID=A0A8S1K578_PARPR|nr:unnamed protein product [Paramecium primaurelia]